MENYHIYEEIGHGRTFTCFKARVKRSLTYLCVKRTPKQGEDGAHTHMDELRHAVGIHQHLDHPNILRFHNWYATNRSIWLVVEYACGGSLGACVAADGGMPEASVRLFAGDLVNALRYLHDQRLLLCEFPLSSMMLDENGAVKLSDFTRAVRMDASGTASTRSVNPHCNMASMAPELLITLIKNAPTPVPELKMPTDVEPGLPSVSSDLWALGCGLYHLATGREPFVRHGQTPHALAHAILNESPDMVDIPACKTNIDGSSVRAAPSLQLQDLIVGLLRKDPKRRYTWEDVLSHSFWTSTSSSANVTAIPVTASLVASPPATVPPGPALRAADGLAATGAAGTAHNLVTGDAVSSLHKAEAVAAETAPLPEESNRPPISDPAMQTVQESTETQDEPPASNISSPETTLQRDIGRAELSMTAGSLMPSTHELNDFRPLIPQMRYSSAALREPERQAEASQQFADATREHTLDQTSSAQSSRPPSPEAPVVSMPLEVMSPDVTPRASTVARTRHSPLHAVAREVSETRASAPVADLTRSATASDAGASGNLLPTAASAEGSLDQEAFGAGTSLRTARAPAAVEMPGRLPSRTVVTILDRLTSAVRFPIAPIATPAVLGRLPGVRQDALPVKYATAGELLGSVMTGTENSSTDAARKAIESHISAMFEAIIRSEHAVQLNVLAYIIELGESAIVANWMLNSSLTEALIRLVKRSRSAAVRARAAQALAVLLQHATYISPLVVYRHGLLQALCELIQYQAAPSSPPLVDSSAASTQVVRRCASAAFGELLFYVCTQCQQDTDSGMQARAPAPSAEWVLPAVILRGFEGALQQECRSVDAGLVAVYVQTLLNIAVLAPICVTAFQPAAVVTCLASWCASGGGIRAGTAASLAATAALGCWVAAAGARQKLGVTEVRASLLAANAALASFDAAFASGDTTASLQPSPWERLLPAALLSVASTGCAQLEDDLWDAIEVEACASINALCSSLNTKISTLASKSMDKRTIECASVLRMCRAFCMFNEHGGKPGAFSQYGVDLSAWLRTLSGSHALRDCIGELATLTCQRASELLVDAASMSSHTPLELLTMLKDTLDAACEVRDNRHSDMKSSTHLAEAQLTAVRAWQACQRIVGLMDLGLLGATTRLAAVWTCIERALQLLDDAQPGTPTDVKAACDAVLPVLLEYVTTTFVSTQNAYQHDPSFPTVMLLDFALRSVALANRTAIMTQRGALSLSPAGTDRAWSALLTFAKPASRLLHAAREAQPSLENAADAALVPLVSAAVVELLTVALQLPPISRALPAGLPSSFARSLLKIAALAARTSRTLPDMVRCIALAALAMQHRGNASMEDVVERAGLAEFMETALAECWSHHSVDGSGSVLEAFSAVVLLTTDVMYEVLAFTGIASGHEIPGADKRLNDADDKAVRFPTLLRFLSAAVCVALRVMKWAALGTGRPAVSHHDMDQSWRTLDLVSNMLMLMARAFPLELSFCLLTVPPEAADLLETGPAMFAAAALRPGERPLDALEAVATTVDTRRGSRVLSRLRKTIQLVTTASLDVVAVLRTGPTPKLRQLLQAAQ